MKETTATTRVYALLGDPVEHSLSPVMQNRAFAEMGADAVYVALRVDADLVGPVMRALARAGGGGNVTIPHKAVAARALDDVTPAVRATGACNLFWWEDSRGLCGDNSDVSAFRAAAEGLLDSRLSGLRVLLVGAGGAARAVAFGCIEAGAIVWIVNRTRSRAETLSRDLGRPAALTVLGDDEEVVGKRFDLAVNATPLGLRSSDPLPLDLDALELGAALDLVYSPSGTRWVHEARRRGLPAEDGRRMLALQAGVALRRWLGREPSLSLLYGVLGLD